MPLVDVVLGYDCNLGCDYCTITPEMRRRELPTAKVLRALTDGRAAGYDAVSFTGGEPTIRGDLLPLIRAARQLGYGDVKVQTNGLLLAQPGNLSRLIAAGASRFHLSIHTHEATAYDELVRREGAYPLMVAGLDALIASGVTLVVDVIIKRDTLARLAAAIRWLHARGVRTAHLWFVSLTDGNRENVASMPRMTDALPAMIELFAFARAGGMELRSLHVPRCLLGADHPHALDPGEGRVLVVTPDATFELKDSRLGGSVYVPACEGCEHRQRCPGIRPDYLARYGDGEFSAARGQGQGPGQEPPR